MPAKKPGKKPPGRPKGKTDPRLKRIKALTNEELIEVGSFLVRGTMAELKQIIESPETVVIQGLFASVIRSVADNGNIDVLEKLLLRLVGEPPPHLMPGDNPNQGRVNVQITLPSNGRESADTPKVPE